MRIILIVFGNQFSIGPFLFMLLIKYFSLHATNQGRSQDWSGGPKVANVSVAGRV